MFCVSSNSARRWWLAMPSSISNCTRSNALRPGGEHQAVREREHIVRRDAEPHGREILRPHALGEHPQIVGVGFELRLVRRLRPAAQARLDAFHLHVRALHDADRHRCPALLAPACGPRR